MPQIDGNSICAEHRADFMDDRGPGSLHAKRGQSRVDVVGSDLIKINVLVFEKLPNSIKTDAVSLNLRGLHMCVCAHGGFEDKNKEKERNKSRNQCQFY